MKKKMMEEVEGKVFIIIVILLCDFIFLIPS